MDKTCDYCGKEFKGNKKARFCSGSHRVLAFRKQHNQPLTPWLKAGDDRDVLIKQLTDQVGELVEANRSLEQKLNQLRVENEKAELGARSLEVTAEIGSAPIKAFKKPKASTFDASLFASMAGKASSGGV